MQDRSFVPFTEEMKKDYTILVPNMLPIHFKLLLSLFRANGYNVELLETDGPQIAETGLKYTHNDTCYPAILVVGQMMDALLSGKYDVNKTALIMFQTGGGCRASNYISLIRKALKKANTITEDDVANGEKKIQNLTDKFCKEIDDLATIKEKEILEI